MTKNLKHLSQALLEKFSDSRGEPVSGIISKPENLAAEIEALKHVVPGERWLSPSGARAYDFMHGDVYCIAITLSLSDEDIMLLKEQSEGTISLVEIPGSIFLFLTDCLDLRPQELDPLWVEQHIAGPAGDEEGVELEVIRSCLEVVSVFQLSDTSIFEKSTSGRYVANYICTFNPLLRGSSRLTPRSLEIIREIFLQERDRLIEENLFEAMATPLLRHAFLEVYRTLEFVFVLPRANALLDRLRVSGGSLDINILDFARHCNKELGWKRVERDSIGRLFREFATSDYSAFVDLFRDCKPFSLPVNPSLMDSEEVRASFVSKASERYYALRNQVAHQFWPEDVLVCDDADWQALIEFTLGCVAYFYRQHLTKVSQYD